ncbi:MAG TPA: cation diffusion facilitator family transporter [Thermomicrobiales bacterium]|nr:cation diffusion facilitator family transporter [Thermomicrobiales bacterium]
MTGDDQAAHDHAHDEPAHLPSAQDHDHDHHDYDHEHAHDDHAHDHGAHNHEHGRFGWLSDWLPFGHGHSHGETAVDSALESSERGLQALRISLIGLGVTAVIQLVIAIASGSVGLLADTIHNFADALTAVPLWIAFVLSRRPANRRYTYGYGRAEDVAGVLIVAIILISALIALWESVQKLRHHETIDHLGWVMAAAVIGFIGNELVATYRIRVGTDIGSAALVADGQHARADGFTSLAVLIGAIGVALGFPLADPIVGVLITIAILFIVKQTAALMWQRLMDAVDPALVEQLEQTAAALPGVQAAHDARLRWLGHRLQAELHIMVDEDLPTWQSHQIVEEVRHALFHAESRLETINIHVDPCGHGGHDPHALTAHHAQPRTA